MARERRGGGHHVPKRTWDWGSEESGGLEVTPVCVCVHVYVCVHQEGGRSGSLEAEPHLRVCVRAHVHMCVHVCVCVCMCSATVLGGSRGRPSWMQCCGCESRGQAGSGEGAHDLREPDAVTLSLQAGGWLLNATHYFPQDSCSLFICVRLTPQTVIILTQGGSDVVEAREQVAGALALVSSEVQRQETPWHLRASVFPSAK